MKSKVAKIIFLISFLPWLLVLICGIWGAIFGVGFLFSTCYGWEGFLLGVLGALLGMTMVPVLPVCLVYEICYIVRNKIPAAGKIPVKKFFIGVGVLCAVVATGVSAYVFRFELGRMWQSVSAKSMIKKAEEQISFNEHDTFADGILGIKACTTDTIFVDYDKCRVGLLLGSVDEFWKVTLKNTTKESEVVGHLEKDYYVQAKIPLSAPGSVLYSFYSEPDCMHQTVALLMELENGELYYADEITEPDIDRNRFSGLHWSRFFVGEGKRLPDLE